MECVIKTCNATYKLSDDGKSCVLIESETPEDVPDVPEEVPGDVPDVPGEVPGDMPTCIDPCLNDQGVFDKTIVGCECLMPEADENCNRDFDFFSCQPTSGLDSGEILTAP